MPVDLLQEHVDCRHTQVQRDIISFKHLKTLFTLPHVWSCFCIFLQYHNLFSDGWRVYQGLCARPTRFLLPTLKNFDSLRGALLRLKSVNAGLDVEFHCFDTDICLEINLMRKQLVIWSWFYLQDETKELMVLKLFKNIFSMFRQYSFCSNYQASEKICSEW